MSWSTVFFTRPVARPTEVPTTKLCTTAIAFRESDDHHHSSRSNRSGLDVLAIGRCGRRHLPPTGGCRPPRTSRRSASSSVAAPPTWPSPPRRLGNTSALISGVGDDPFGRFVRTNWPAWRGQHLRHHPRPVPHPGDVLRDLPPDDFPLYLPQAVGPDLQIRPTDRRRRRPRRPAVLVNGHRTIRRAQPHCAFRSLGLGGAGPR